MDHVLPTEPRGTPCELCPSAHYPLDPEAEFLLENGNGSDLKKSLFICAWTPDKLCKGWCDLVQKKIGEDHG